MKNTNRIFVWVNTKQKNSNQLVNDVNSLAANEPNSFHKFTKTKWKLEETVYWVYLHEWPETHLRKRFSVAHLLVI